VIDELNKSFKKYPNIPTIPAGASLGADLPEFVLPNLVAPLQANAPGGKASRKQQ
jgi:hypothetical protein